MAGHSKWANIKHRKGAQDVKRGKIFTKLIREITISARSGGADHSANPRLRAAMAAARAQNMPKDTIEKAIKRGTGDMDGVEYQEVRYEGYGPGGVAILVDTLTDNINRTVADVRSLLGKHGGNLGTTGCVSYLFDQKGQILLDEGSEETLMEITLEAGAEDLIADGDGFEIITRPEDFEKVLQALATAGFDKPASAEITMRPQTTVTLGEKPAESMLKLMDVLEDHDDVQRVYANFDIPDDVMERLSNG
ncbi:MAG: YebC/PmpR family DNA-binding transcriptional regulator [Magnetococcales bacterium]|nr:YebC/PmpR family DNA-binding transcriptional regulator [Magnetococcales bacterium]MBF0323265.1 YebC/PmpR family DNA-binding transcriptional regulator [Magnetococcales bacterium]